MRRTRGVSPVVATLLLVAISAAIGFYVGSMVISLTRSYSPEAVGLVRASDPVFTGAYYDPSTDTVYFYYDIAVQNIGTSSLYVSQLTVRAALKETVSGFIVVGDFSTTINRVIPPGSTVTLQIVIGLDKDDLLDYYPELSPATNTFLWYSTIAEKIVILRIYAMVSASSGSSSSSGGGGGGGGGGSTPEMPVPL